MKIKKKKVQAADLLPDGTVVEVAEIPEVAEVIVAEEPAADNCCESCKQAICHVQSAIECLAECAKNGDQVARENIANLSVVLLDLKSSCNCG